MSTATTNGKVNEKAGEILAASKSITIGMEEGRLVSDDNLAEIASFNDAMDLIKRVFAGEVIEAGDVLGNGFVVLMVTKNPSDKSEKGYFYSLTCVALDGRKFIINDGGTGIADQLDALYQRHPETMGKPMRVKKGLRRSDYMHPDHGACTTYYLNTSK